MEVFEHRSNYQYVQLENNKMQIRKNKKKNVTLKSFIKFMYVGTLSENLFFKGSLSLIVAVFESLFDCGDDELTDNE